MASVAEFIQCDSRNYTAGCQGDRIRKIVVHYTGHRGVGALLH